MYQIDSENMEVLNEEFVRALAWGRGGVGVYLGGRVWVLRPWVGGVLRVGEPGSGWGPP